MTNDELDELNLIPANFYVLRKYINKYTNRNIPLIHWGAHVSPRLIHLPITNAIDILQDNDSEAILILNDFSAVLSVCTEHLDLLPNMQESTDKDIVLIAYYENVKIILTILTNSVLYSLWSEVIFNKLTILE